MKNGLWYYTCEICKHDHYPFQLSRCFYCDIEICNECLIATRGYTRFYCELCFAGIECEGCGEYIDEEDKISCCNLCDECYNNNNKYIPTP